MLINVKNVVINIPIYFSAIILQCNYLNLFLFILELLNFL